jgi:hypothetical protein
MDADELKKRIAIADQQLKDAKELRLSALFIKQVKDTRAAFVKQLAELEPDEVKKHWYFR